VADAVKVLIVERNGVEIDDYEELNLTASAIQFNAPGFAASDVQEAIEEAGKFGMSKIYSSQPDETSTTSTSVWSVKNTISPTGLISGVYILFFSCIGRTAGANREIDVRIMDGATNLWECRVSLIRTQGLLPISGYVILPGVSGSKTYTLEFKVGGTATTAFLKNSTLSLWRFS
jgi:hypothetical protein